MSNRRCIEVVNRKQFKHTRLLTDDVDIIKSITIQRALLRVSASQILECHFYWNDVEVYPHLVKCNRVELRVKRDGRLLSEYIQQKKYYLT